MSVKLSSSLPAGPGNGLAYITGELVGDPQRTRWALVELDVKSISNEIDTELVTPTIRIKRIMPVLKMDLPTAQLMMERSAESLTGQAMLPIPDEDMDAALRQIQDSRR